MKRVEYKDIDYLLCYMIRHKEEKKIDLSIDYTVENDFCIPIPGSFVKVSDEYARAKYYSRNRPELILKDKDGESNLLFQKMQKNSDDVGAVLELAKKAVYDVDCTIKVYEEGRIIKDNYLSSWFDFKSFAGRECIYNLMFIIGFGKKKVFGSFNCKFENYDTWKPIVLEMLNNIKIGEEE